MEESLYRTEWLVILRNVVVILISLIICKVLKNAVDYFRNHAYFKPCGIKTWKCNPFILYFIGYKSIYKNSRPGCPVLCLFLQALLGDCCELFGKERIIKLYLGLTPGIFFYKPETVEVVLSSPLLIDKSIQYKLLDSWLGKGLFTSSGEKWRKRRKLLTPTFHFSILEDFIPVVQEQSNVFVSKLLTLTQEPWVDIVPLAVLCTLDVICQTAMGISMNAQSNENQEYVKAVHEIADAIISRGFRPWLYSDFLYNLTSEGRRHKVNLQRVHGFIREVIKEKKANMLAREVLKQEAENAEVEHHYEAKRKAFLEFLLECHVNDSSFTEENIREEVETFMFAGHDTTGMGLSFVLYCVGLYPLVQKKIVEELDEIFQNDKDREVTREDLTKMKYLECTIKETFRLYPPAPFFMRECKETFEVLGHKVYPGSFCFIFPYALHRDRESFPDPEKFIPERFFPENSRGRHPFAYIPFSAGPRNCIGQKFAMLELKTVLANVLRRLRVTSLDPRDRVLVVPNLVLRNAAPLRLRFETR